MKMQASLAVTLLVMLVGVGESISTVSFPCARIEPCGALWAFIKLDTPLTTVHSVEASSRSLLGAFSPPSSDEAKMNAFKKWTEDNKLPPHKVQIGKAPGHRLEATEDIKPGEIMLSGESV